MTLANYKHNFICLVEDIDDLMKFITINRKTGKTWYS
jgi:hypothetical protein